MAPVCAVVVAGGSGQRFGNPGGKQLVNVAGRPLMSWSIRAFDRSDKVGHIVVVCPAERRAEMRRLAIDPFDYDTPISFADAGATRQDSTRAGVHAVPAGFEYVAIHDGARPLVTEEIVYDAMHSAALYKCAAPAVPVTDTVKETDHDTVVRTLNRSALAAIQTPQAFVPEIIKAALTRAIAEKKEYTDDCAAVEAMGVKIHLSKGSPENIKITGPVDIPTAEAILKTRGE